MSLSYVFVAKGLRKWTDSWVNKQRKEDSCSPFLYPSEMGHIYTQLLYIKESELGDQISSPIHPGEFSLFRQYTECSPTHSEINGNHPP